MIDHRLAVRVNVGGAGDKAERRQRDMVCRGLVKPEFIDVLALHWRSSSGAADIQAMLSAGSDAAKGIDGG